MRKVRFTQLRLLVGLAAGLLIVGLAIDLGIAQPRLQRVNTLRAEHAEYLDQLLEHHKCERERKSLARFLAVDDLTELLTQENGEDPLSYLGHLLNESGLTRLELSTIKSEDMQPLRRTRFSVRVLGRYEKLLSLIRTIEKGQRLASVDAFSIESVKGQKALEGRLNISIYDPMVRS